MCTSTPLKKIFACLELHPFLKVLLEIDLSQQKSKGISLLFCYTGALDMKWRLKRMRVRRKRRTSVTLHYLQHKEVARIVVHQKLQQWNSVYGFSYNRVAIRNTTRSWGSCTSLKNLNFSYKILFLPPHLQDYIIIHELCHLQELNHGPNFWKLVETHVPNYATCKRELVILEKMQSGVHLPATIDAV